MQPEPSMPSILPRRYYADRLIWDYLNGEMTPSRAQRLSQLLARRPAMREKLVDSSVLHGMLQQYYRDHEDAIDTGKQDATPRRKRRPGKSSAA